MIENIIIKHFDCDGLQKINIENWFPWSCEPSFFDWYYDEQESCYLYEGRVIIRDGEENSIEIKKGDFVVFPKGFSCKWEILEKVEKVYKFDNMFKINS